MGDVCHVYTTIEQIQITSQYVRGILAMAQLGSSIRNFRFSSADVQRSFLPAELWCLGSGPRDPDFDFTVIVFASGKLPLQDIDTQSKMRSNLKHLGLWIRGLKIRSRTTAALHLHMVTQTVHPFWVVVDGHSP